MIADPRVQAKSSVPIQNGTRRFADCVAEPKACTSGVSRRPFDPQFASISAHGAAPVRHLLSGRSN